MNDKWDRRFLDLCRQIAGWSRDPSTKCGAIIVRPNRTIVSTGYNGFPRYVADLDSRLHDRSLKYELTVHCEMNAALSAHESIEGCTLYTTPCLSCCRCAVHMIQAGIKRVVAPAPSEDMLSRWRESLERSRNLFAEAGVEVVELGDA